MAETPKKLKSDSSSINSKSPAQSILPPTPNAICLPRRSLRHLLSVADPKTPQKPLAGAITKVDDPETPKTTKNGKKLVERSKIPSSDLTVTVDDVETPQTTKNGKNSVLKMKNFARDAPFTPVIPDLAEPNKCKRSVKVKRPGSPSPVSKSVNSGQKTKCRSTATTDDAETPKTTKNGKKLMQRSKYPMPNAPFAPVSPDPAESKKRKRSVEVKRPKSISVLSKPVNSRQKTKKRVYYKKVVFDGGEFEIGDDVYVKRKENASSDEEPEMEECRICFRSGKGVMIECDDCLGGFHLKCMSPPLKEVPEGEWVCGFCEARKKGGKVQLPIPPKGKKLSRTAREKLLSADLWAARILSLWKEPDGTYWFRGRWYLIPEETAAGRQPHNLRRELYHTNDFDDIEMESVLRHCYVLNPKEFSKAINEGDDVFLCEYEYDVHWHSFKRLADIDNEENDQEAGSDEESDSNQDPCSDSEEELEYEDMAKTSLSTGLGNKNQFYELAANSRKGRIFGLQKIGTKKIPEHVRCHKQTELERAKATLLLCTLPKSLPCRNKEMEEITAFVKGATCEDQCLGRCLYIHGVPGTGKTMTVLAVMRNLRSEVDAGHMRPFSFVEINGLKLASPENVYRVIYEALSGHRVGWKKALHSLNERFSDCDRVGKEENQPCVLLIDELDLLVTRNQSVLYNILDWPNRPNSKLVVIGIANTMDLPEKLLPRISSRMGIQRLCFGPYNYHQLQEIISTRLKGIDVFERQAIEFASRKVAAISGDARRALEICRRAAELADYRFKQLAQSTMASSAVHDASAEKHLVGMSDVEAAIQEMFQAPHIQVIKSCSKLGKIMLVAMVHELHKTGMVETTFEKLATTVSCFCKSNGEACPGWDTLLKVGCKLGECRIILCEEGSKHRLQKLQLNFPSDDVAFALKNCPRLPWLAKYL